MGVAVAAGEWEVVQGWSDAEGERRERQYRPRPVTIQTYSRCQMPLRQEYGIGDFETEFVLFIYIRCLDVPLYGFPYFLLWWW